MKDRLHPLLKSPQEVEKRLPAVGGVFRSNKLHLPCNPSRLAKYFCAGMYSTGPTMTQLGEQLDHTLIGGWNRNTRHFFMSVR